MCKCAYCGIWFKPIRQQIIHRINAIEKTLGTENRLYCSCQCKDNCPIYNRRSHLKGYKPATSREVQPELRQLVFERDNYTCQKCNKHRDKLNIGLRCHHIYPLNEDPIESADVDTCFTVCESCHQ